MYMALFFFNIPYIALHSVVLFPPIHLALSLSLSSLIVCLEVKNNERLTLLPFQRLLLKISASLPVQLSSVTIIVSSVALTHIPYLSVSNAAVSFLLLEFIDSRVSHYGSFLSD